MSCSVCLDTFRNPKLLPCMHTFCRKCLEKHAKCKTVDIQANRLNCPLCRHTVCIPSSGMDTLFSNYFVTDSRCEPDNICEECNKSVMNTCCLLCDDSLCLDCKRYHSCEINETWTELVLSDSDSDDDEADLPSNLMTLFSEFNIPATKIEANVIRKFSVSNDSTAHVTSILTLIQGGVFVIINHGPNVFWFDQHYNLTERIKVGNGLRDIAYGPNEQIYILQDTTNLILELCEKKVQIFATLPRCRPQGMSFFPDGRSVVAASCDDSERLSEQDERNQFIHDFSRMILIGSDGNVCVDQKVRKTNFTGVVVIPKLNSMCFLNSRNGNVLFCLFDGTFLGQFGDRNHGNIFDLSEDICFVPKGLCCDGDENIIVYDLLSHSLHLIDSTGRLIAMINSKSLSGLGSPGTIAVAPDGNLWIGDSESSTIRILKISRFKNTFHSPE